MIEILAMALTIFAFGALAAVATMRERRRWNGGVCAKNGLPWELRDRDSQGGRLYKAGEEYCWISWPVDK